MPRKQYRKLTLIEWVETICESIGKFLDKNKWVATAILGILSSLIALFEIAEARKSEAEARKMEMSKPYLEKQLVLFEKVTTLVSSIAITQPEERSHSEIREFYRLYHGQLALVHGENVRMELVNFANAVKERRPVEETQKIAIALAIACRNELAHSWEVEQWFKKEPSFFGRWFAKSRMPELESASKESDATTNAEQDDTDNPVNSPENPKNQPYD